MSKRKSVRTYTSEEVQGEGSKVVLSSVKVREIRRLRKLGDTPDFDEFEGGIELLAKHIVSWNWRRASLRYAGEAYMGARFTINLKVF